MRLRLSTLLMVALLLVASAAKSAAEMAPPALADTLEQRLVPCGSCHGKQGEGSRQSEYYPRIAGKPAGYLYRQLLNFRDGRRKYPQMVYFVRHLSDSYLSEIAARYATLHPAFSAPVRTSAGKDALARGEALVRRGDSARDIPACAACHGEALTGTLPAIPGLIGLYPDYIIAQLGAWQRGIRRAIEPDCMETIASRLNGSDISAVAAWLAAQPASFATPAPQARTEPPIQCGSQAPVAGEPR